MLPITFAALFVTMPIAQPNMASFVPQGPAAVPSQPALPSGGTPEPTTMLLLAGGALAYAGCRRQARSKRQEA
ncbi:MAG: PEP-CTERM sorting domain-containing protein [Planctomycetota bacterium]|jgi:hypothetical protein